MVMKFKNYLFGYWHGKHSFAKAMLVWFVAGHSVLFCLIYVCGSIIFSKDIRFIYPVLLALYTPIPLAFSIRCWHRIHWRWLSVTILIVHVVLSLLIYIFFGATAPYTLGILSNTLTPSEESPDGIFFALFLSITIWFISFPLYSFTAMQKKRPI